LLSASDQPSLGARLHVEHGCMHVTQSGAACASWSRLPARTSGGFAREASLRFRTGEVVTVLTRCVVESRTLPVWRLGKFTNLCSPRLVELFHAQIRSKSGPTNLYHQTHFLAQESVEAGRSAASSRNSTWRFPLSRAKPRARTHARAARMRSMRSRIFRAASCGSARFLGR
jgi:hypothetical protein